MNRKKIESAWRAQVLSSWYKNIIINKYSILFVFIIIAILSYQVFRSSEKTVTEIEVSGILVGVHANQSNTGSSVITFSAKLESGKIITFLPPANVIFKKNANVLLSKTTTDRNNTYYYFIKYTNNS